MNSHSFNDIDFNGTLDTMHMLIKSYKDGMLIS